MENSTIFHVHKVEKFNWKSSGNFMSTKWKSLAENSTVFHVNEVENFNWKALQYLMSAKWRSLTGKPCDISCPQSGKV